ncbi:hypothetical protein TI03_06625, partial [Achromatium sp. WMS1]
MAGEVAEISILSSQLRILTLNHQREVQTHLHNSIATTEQISLLVSMLVVLVMIFLSWKMTRALAVPLQAITKSFAELTKGKLDQPIPNRNRQDEIGALAKAAEVFKDKARQLADASRYKTEFLANMSHELRTPLNSMLILSRMLAENTIGNLSTEQVESATIVYESGTALLAIINDILDLSKIEAGKIDVHRETNTFLHFSKQLNRQFTPLAMQKGINFYIDMQPK